MAMFNKLVVQITQLSIVFSVLVDNVKVDHLITYLFIERDSEHEHSYY